MPAQKELTFTARIAWQDKLKELYPQHTRSDACNATYARENHRLVGVFYGSGSRGFIWIEKE